jgi:SAM-dependent methyltransferase
MQATLRTNAAASRGERLYPPRSSRVYWILSSIRLEMEAIVTRHLAGGQARASSLLDFGCGNMPYRPLFEPHVGAYVGCDLPGNEAAECVLESPDRLPQAGESAAVLLSTSVLEHVIDPSAYLAECRRVLNDDGLMVLTTHGVWRYHPDPLDLWRWTSAGLKRLLHESGFSVIHFRGILGPAATGLQLWQDATLPRVPARLQPLFTRFMQGHIRWADRRCPQAVRDADASVYVVLARKG